MSISGSLGTRGYSVLYSLGIGSIGGWVGIVEGILCWGGLDSSGCRSWIYTLLLVIDIPALAGRGEEMRRWLLSFVRGVVLEIVSQGLAVAAGKAKLEVAGREDWTEREREVAVEVVDLLVVRAEKELEERVK